MTYTYFITGANRGIGLELVAQLLAKGQRVVATARDPQNSKELQALKERYSDRLEVYALDVADQKSVTALAEKVSGRTIDTLINNAGVYLDRDSSFSKLEDSVLEQTFQVNVLGPVRVTRAFLKNLKASPKPMLVNITSLMGSIGDNESGGYYAYRMSKAALNMFNKSFSIDHPEILSLLLHPGWVQTDMGGPNATTSREDSVRGILALLDRVTIKETGKFFDFEGDELPW